MTRNEWLEKARDAQRDSVEKRWKYLIVNPDADVPECAFCHLSLQLLDVCLQRYKACRCSVCPMHQGVEKFTSGYLYCCEEWQSWCEHPTHQKAQKIIDRIKGLNLEAFANELVKRNVLESDAIKKENKP